MLAKLPLQARPVIRVGLLLLISAWMMPYQAQVYRIQHCFQGCPVGAPDSNHLLVRSIYTLSYNTDYKTAQWVAYEVHPGAIGIASSLSRQAVADEDVAETLSSADFLSSEESGYLRGQFVPLVSFAATPYWPEVNYLTNAVARSSSLSQGAWYGLDWAIRNLVNREGPVHVLSGPVFYDDVEPIRLNTDLVHRVPDAFFKIVINRRRQAAAFLFEQDTAVHVHHCELTANIDDIENLTGLELFPQSNISLELSLPSRLGCR